MLLLILLLALPIALAQNSFCVQCASPILRDNWAVTSLSKRPDNLAFDIKCNGQVSGDDIGSFYEKCVDSVCFESLMPVDGAVAFVRGCYGNFVPFPTNYSKATFTQDKCEYGPVNGRFISTSPSAMQQYRNATAYAAIRFIVPPTTENQPLNTRFYERSALFNNTVTYFDGCDKLQEQQCIQCSKIGGDGECDRNTKNYCSGAYCLKYEGFLGNDWFETRTCSPVNPFSGDQCSWIPSSASISLLTNDIGAEYKATHCYCKGVQCNGSSSSSLLLLLLLPLLSSVLPFSSSTSSSSFS